MLEKLKPTKSLRRLPVLKMKQYSENNLQEAGP